MLTILSAPLGIPPEYRYTTYMTRRARMKSRLQLYRRRVYHIYSLGGQSPPNLVRRGNSAVRFKSRILCQAACMADQRHNPLVFAAVSTRVI